MNKAFRTVADTLLKDTTQHQGGVPGVVAMATDRHQNFYEGAAGRREAGKDAPMTADTVFALASATKAITGVAVMQLVEEGKIRLEDAAKNYVPELANIGVLTGFDESGQPQTRPPRREVTVNDLMLHTSGLGYEFTSAEDLKYRIVKNIPPLSASDAAIQTVLLHDPGAAWTYGVSIDWLGKVVEQQRGQRLGEVMRDRIFEPLGMTDTGFTLTAGMKARLATIHMRAPDGQLTPNPEMVLPQPAILDCGGHALYGTVSDYMKFIRMVLNDGAGQHRRVLKPETVVAMCEDGLKPMGLRCTGWTTAIPQLSNSSEFFPGTDKGWGYTFMINREDLPTGRPAGAVAWAGLFNLFYWIDRKNGVGGFWGTQILPFQDIASYPAFLDFEAAVYRSLKQ